MSLLLEEIDREKPKIRIDECLCSGCWKVAKSDVAVEEKWKAYDFRFLAMAVLCPACQYRFGDEFDALKEGGL